MKKKNKISNLGIQNGLPKVFRTEVPYGCINLIFLKAPLSGKKTCCRGYVDGVSFFNGGIRKGYIYKGKTLDLEAERSHI